MQTYQATAPRPLAPKGPQLREAAPTTNRALEPQSPPKLEPAAITRETPDAAVDPENTVNQLNMLKWATDAGIRSVARYIEIFCENPVIRVPVRAATETARKLTELIGFKKLHGENVTGNDYRKAFSRVFENTISSAILEPSMYANRMARMGAGFANMGIRFMSRGLMFATKLLEKEGLGLEHLADEGFSRTMFRSVFSDTTNPVVRLTLGFFEQLGINAWVHSLPVVNAVKKVKTKMTGNRAAA